MKYISEMNDINAGQENCILKKTIIRKINGYEIDIVMKIWYESNIDVHNFVKKSHWEKLYSRVKDKLMKLDVYVYEENNIIKGFICIDDSGYIHELYVVKSFRSKGIGKKLLSFSKQMNKQLTLNVFEKNKNAVAFYLKQDFRIEKQEIEEETAEEGYLMKWIK